VLEAESSPALFRNLGVGVVLSVVVHLVLATGLVAQTLLPDLSLNQDAENEPETAPPLQLGIDRSQVATINWVGFETPTEHSAQSSTVEQAAVTPVVGLAEAASEEEPTPQTTPTEASEPVAEPQPEPEPTPPSEPAPETEATPTAEPTPPMPLVPVEMLGPIQAAPATESALIQMEPGELLRPPKPIEPAATPPEATPTESEPKPEAKPATAPEPTPAQESAKPADAAGTPGIRDEREADASAITKTLEVRPGRPIAAEGLQIATVRPDWGTTASLIFRCRNPIVAIHFDRTGKVRRAEYVVREGKRQDAGIPAMSEPLMDAIYRWTAKGVALESLGKDQTLTVEIRLLINGS